MTFRFSACLLSVALLCACSTSAENIGLDLAPGVEDTSDAASVPDLAPDVAGPDLTQPDTTLPDFQIEPDLTVDTAPEIPTPQCDPGEGCFLDKCEENSQCESGWCVEHMGEGVCSSLCEDECPSGWSCKQVGAGGPDVIYICVSDFSNLCKPCTTTEGCKAVGGAEDVCIDYGAEGSFCGGACDAGTGAGEECPWGFSCADVLTVEGVELSQCIADAGVCPCTGKSIDLALTTPCQISNEFGSCDGKRVCTEGGLSHCDALVPESETCNGIDDNCDGDVDEPDEVAGDYINLCFDDNDCSQDLCNGEAGCEYLPLDGDECKDGDPCTAADLCVQGVCVGDPVVCEDGNPCTDDVCTENGGCDHLPNQEDCDDGDPCTLGDACKNSVCSGVQVPCDCQADADCADLEDDDACNGSLVCDLSALPYQCAVDPDSVIVCPPPLGVDAFCLTPQCDPATGGCSMAPDNEGLLCDNGDACTANDKCAGGACSAGSGVNCNDGNVCTDDSCDPNSGCQYDANSMACSDGNVCTTEDTCAGGACVGGQGLICDDDNACNGIETCDSDAGCLAGEPLACDDGDVCNGQETCAPGQGCQSGTPLNCDDNNPCTLDQCNPQTGCQNVAQPGNCDDGNACTTGDHCVDGDCVYEELEECDDENLCTDDYCDPAVGCITTLNDAPCDDGNACTTGDQCQLGGCAGGDEIVCDDGNICTDDSCDPLAGCQFAPNNDECDDDNECTANDKCKAGWCAPGEQQECDDGNVCTDDSCDPVLGCVFQTNAVPCDDGNTCTTDDTCADGACEGAGLLNCNDGNPCTDDSCAPDAGCVFSANTIPCDDGNACTETDACSGGSCKGADLLNCDDGNLCTTDLCDLVDGCVFYTNSIPCDDSNACTTDDSCSEGTCAPGAPLICDDGNGCTDDSCVALQGCLFEHNAAPCDDGNECTGNDTCGTGQCDGDAITCDDNDKCTTNTCNPDVGCAYAPITPCCGNGVVEAGESCDDGNDNNNDGCKNDCSSPPQSCSQVAIAHCLAKGWHHVGAGTGNIVCTKNGQSTGHNCDQCDKYHIYVWVNGSKELHCPDHNYSTVAGNFYSAHTPCSCGDNLDLCGSWNMQGCTPD